MTKLMPQNPMSLNNTLPVYKLHPIDGNGILATHPQKVRGLMYFGSGLTKNTGLLFVLVDTSNTLAGLKALTLTAAFTSAKTAKRKSRTAKGATAAGLRSTKTASLAATGYPC